MEEPQKTRLKNVSVPNASLSQDSCTDAAMFCVILRLNPSVLGQMYIENIDHFSDSD